MGPVQDVVIPRKIEASTTDYRATSAWNKLVVIPRKIETSTT